MSDDYVDIDEEPDDDFECLHPNKVFHPEVDFGTGFHGYYTCPDCGESWEDDEYTG